MDGALRGFVGGELGRKMGNRRSGGVEADVVFHGGEVDDRFAVNEKGRHAVADFLGGAGQQRVEIGVEIGELVSVVGGDGV